MGDSAAARGIYPSRLCVRELWGAAHGASLVGESELSSAPMQVCLLLDPASLHEAVHLRNRKQMEKAYNKNVQLAAGNQQGQ